MSDDLYNGPTLLAPGPKEPRVSGNVIASAILIPLILAFAFVIIVFYGVFTAAQVDGPSMAPTLHDTDHVLITHGLKDPKRGDIVVTRVVEPEGPTKLVKRIIGLPGDTVEIRDDVAIVNGVAEPKRGQVTTLEYSLSQPAIRVPAGSIYVMGDNRAVSSDSRDIGPVPESGVVGKVVVIFSPVTRLGLVH